MARDLYFFDGATDTTDSGSLEIRFDDGSLVALSVALDGESVRACGDALEIPSSLDLEDGAHCSFERIDLLQDGPFSSLRGAMLSSVGALIERWRQAPHDEILLGWTLHFGTGDRITYLNNGDQSLLLLNQDPPDSTDSETRVERLPG